MTDNLGQSQVIPYLKGLSNHGYSITIISCEKPINYLKRKSDIQEILDQSSIKWHPVQYHKSPPVLSSIFDLRQIKNSAIKLHNIDNFQIVHCRSYMASIVGQMLKKRFGFLMIMEINKSR